MEVRHEDEMRKHWLILKDICKDEEAEYACQAINVAGEAWCFSDVVVHMSEGVVFVHVFFVVFLVLCTYMCVLCLK